MSRTSQPLPYTASPYLLALSDLILWLRITFVWPPWAGIPSIILPILPYRSGKLDELYPTPANIYNLILQLTFTTVQAIFVLTLPLFATISLGSYTPIFITTVLLFVFTNRTLSDLLLNGYTREFTSNPTLLPQSTTPPHPNEKWIFINGVAAGSNWTQHALDRLCLTFRRPIHGIHNPTRGIVVDLLECVVERTFSYPTPSTRRIYSRLLSTISNPKYTKIMLIMHSQGAIEGGLALDWLFATVPASQLSRVEVYTFGSAANHFNNPITTTTSADGFQVDDLSPSNGRILKHIEHYANSADYVSKFGILNFRPVPLSILRAGPGRWSRARRMYMYMWDAVLGQEVENRYVGRLFVREGSGHQFVGNYMDDFFPVDWALMSVVDEAGGYMDGVVDEELLDESDLVVVTKGAVGNGTRVRDVSRLWAYRNGLTPSD